MFDGAIRPKIDPILNRLATRLVQMGATADRVTIIGFILGCFAALAIIQGWFLTGLALLLISRIFDGLDGAVAKQTQSTDFGGFLDIVLDFAFYGMIPLAFAIYDPAQNALAAAVLIFTFYANGASFLAFSTLAAKQGLETDVRGSKSIFFTTGLTEATETIVLFALFCLIPSGFTLMAYIFAALCLYTTISRIMQAKQIF